MKDVHMNMIIHTVSLIHQKIVIMVQHMPLAPKLNRFKNQKLPKPQKVVKKLVPRSVPKMIRSSQQKLKKLPTQRPPQRREKSLNQRRRKHQQPNQLPLRKRKKPRSQQRLLFCNLMLQSFQ